MGIFYNKTTFKVHRDAQEIPVKAKVDVLVCGGGPAGIGAALGAAKGEVSVMIIEKNNCLGGLATTGLVTTFAGSSIFSDSEDDDPTVNRRQVIKGVVWEFIERLIQEDGAISPEELNKTGQNDAATFDIEVYKRVADEIMEEWGINLLYHTMITGAIMDGETIKGVVIENKAGCQAILADVIIDATGDGDVAYLAGASYKMGRDEDGKTQPLTTMFRIGGMPEVGKEQIEKFSKYPKGKVQPYFLFWEAPEFIYGHVCIFGTPRKGEYRCEMTRSVDKNGLNPDDLTKAEIECRRQIPKIVEYFRKEYPGAENVYLIDSAGTVGGKDLIFTLFLSLMMIPNELVVITNFTTITNLDLRNTFTGLILPSVTSVFYIYLLRENFAQIPDELYYAAKVDGTSDLRYLRKVMVPICKPTLITIVILKVIECWNSYVWPRLITDDPDYYLVSNGIQEIRENGFGRENIPAMMAAVVVISVPLVVLFLVFRKKVMAGVARGGTKG